MEPRPAAASRADRLHLISPGRGSDPWRDAHVCLTRRRLVQGRQLLCLWVYRDHHPDSDHRGNSVSLRDLDIHNQQMPLCPAPMNRERVQPVLL